ncbi:hypothetical protein NKR19_g2224 [Coniochaeta hoffmannii]|uniref:Uncharacterized protein n=1 Tax=Coniochaeta hoffmannii TaxID=91930 RepID=A0AA38SIY6_9PEZI|nr:hypothetical protein NKR19_g2224 [Coniochaeta hoffmannii]
MLSRSNFSIRRLMPQRRQNSDDDLFWDNDENACLKVTDGRGSPSPSLKVETQTRKNNKSIKSLPSPTKLTFDLLEALEIQPNSEEMATPIPILPPTPPRRKSTQIPNGERIGQFENAQQIIREANEAFDRVGNDPQAEEQPGFDNRRHQATSITPPPTRLAPAAPVRKRPAPLRQSILKKRLSKPALSPLKSPTRSASVSKTTRQKSQKSRNGRTLRPVVQKQRSKWSVNAKDLLTVRLFSRLEVDEVLSPTRLREIRMSGASQIQSRRSSETLRTIQSDGSDTPVDPFILQDLPSRIGAAGVRLSIPSPIIEVPTPRTFEFNLTTEPRRPTPKDHDKPTVEETSFSASPSSDETTPTQRLPEAQQGNAMVLNDLPFPVPPAKNPARFASTSRKDLPQLPSIPEVLVIPPEIFSLPGLPSSHPPPPPPSPPVPRFSPDDNDPFIRLPSTLYTLTMPTFRHGPIRIARADVALAHSSGSKLATAAVLDDTLDWTAFHMAISGGAGDLLGESTDYSRRDAAAEDEVDDLCEWFAEFGFAGYGRLVGGGRSQPASPLTVVEGSCSPVSSGSSSSSSSSGGGSGRHLPIPVDKEFPTGFWNGRLGDGAGSRFDRARSVGLRRWTVEGHPKSSRRPSVDSLASLPQSPMLDLIVSQDARGNEYIVPMGYNLSHDLGDFLTWEAQNVYAAAFLGGEEGDVAELEG